MSETSSLRNPGDAQAKDCLVSQELSEALDGVNFFGKLYCHGVRDLRCRPFLQTAGAHNELMKGIVRFSSSYQCLCTVQVDVQYLRSTCIRLCKMASLSARTIRESFQDSCKSAI